MLRHPFCITKITSTENLSPFCFETAVCMLIVVLILEYQNMMKSSDHWDHKMKINDIPTNALFIQISYICPLTMALRRLYSKSVHILYNFERYLLNICSLSFKNPRDK